MPPAALHAGRTSAATIVPRPTGNLFPFKNQGECARSATFRSDGSPAPSAQAQEWKGINSHMAAHEAYVHEAYEASQGARVDQRWAWPNHMEATHGARRTSPVMASPDEVVGMKPYMTSSPTEPSLQWNQLPRVSPPSFDEVSSHPAKFKQDFRAPPAGRRNISSSGQYRKHKEHMWFNGKGDWSDYYCHFTAVVDCNEWSDAECGLQLAISLVEDAREVLAGLPEGCRRAPW